MLKQMLNQVLKQNPSKSQAKLKQSKRQGLKALVETSHHSLQIRNARAGDE